MASEDIPHEAIWDAEIQTLFTQPQNLEVKGKHFAMAAVERLLHSGRLNSHGIETFANVWDSLIIQNPPKHVSVMQSLEEARQAFETKGLTSLPQDRDAYIYYGFMHGGMECGWHHTVIVQGISLGYNLSGFILGIEYPSFKTTREPVFTMEEKLAIWNYLAPDGSIIFAIPPRPEYIDPDYYYDSLIRRLGLWKNPHILYVGSSDDPPNMVEARLRRVHSPVLYKKVSLAKGWTHISELLLC